MSLWLCHGVIAAEGFFMIVAWIILAGVGLFMPRYMKKAWAVPEDGIAWWFKVTFNMVSGLC